jgi:hypothetical protein
MRTATDFLEVNDDLHTGNQQMNAEVLVEPEFYAKASFDDLTDLLYKYESLDDMVAIVAQAPNWRRRHAAKQAIELLRLMQGSDITGKQKDIELRCERSRTQYYLRHGIAELQNALDRIKTFWAGLKTHEEAVCDFLIFRATSDNLELSKRWTWSVGEDVPATNSTPNHIRSLPAEVTDLPDNLLCPISHTLMQDAVTASDGHTYSRAAIERWFDVRLSSPMTGLQLSDRSLADNTTICDSANDWISGNDISAALAGASSQTAPGDHDNHAVLTLDFITPFGSFEREVPRSMHLLTLHQLIFRGLKGRTPIFQLAKGSNVLQPYTRLTVNAARLRDDDKINVRIADETDHQQGPTGRASQNHSLIKVYEPHDVDKPAFSCWEKTGTTHTLSSIVWKYWRHELATSYPPRIQEKVVWVNMKHNGDGYRSGEPQSSTQLLSRYFNRIYCRGHLEHEKVFSEDGPNRGDVMGQPLVLKVYMSRPLPPEDRREAKLTCLDVLKQMFEVSATVPLYVHSSAC